MHLSNNDLYDLHIAIVRFRFDPSYPHNKEIAERIKALIDAPQADDVLEPNIVRRELARIDGLGGDNWQWVFTDDIYYGSHRKKTIPDDVSLPILSAGFAELIKCFELGDAERIYCLADAMHNIPTIFVEEPEKNVLKIILSEIGYYRKKYDESFLKDILEK